MSRTIRVGAAQLGPIARTDARSQVVERLLVLLRQAASAGCDLVVYPELALTTFFPRWNLHDVAEIDAFYEQSMPNEDTAALFDEARRLGIAFHLGYAELVVDAGRRRRFNTAILVDKAGREEGFDMVGQSAIIAPSGEIVAMCRTRADELVVADCDLDAGRHYRETIFNFGIHRRTEHYSMIVERTGAGPPLVPVDRGR